MTYELSEDADKFLSKKRKKDKRLFDRCMSKIDQIIENPYRFNLLVANGPWYKARVGKYRIIFKIIEDKKVCFILIIAHRDEVYETFNKLINSKLI